jgi:porphobilinogen deaminase
VYDIAVHSLKDMPTALPAGLVLSGVTEREDPRDAVVLSARLAGSTDSPSAIRCLADLPPGSVIGSSSLRREAYIRQSYPHLVVTSVRGNLQTRMAKLDAVAALPSPATASSSAPAGTGSVEAPGSDAAAIRAAAWAASSTAGTPGPAASASAAGGTPTPQRYDALILAAAGLHRLGWGTRVSWYLELEETGGTAVGQGALGLECRAEDAEVTAMLHAVSHGPTLAAVSAERAFLRALQGGCQVPIATRTTVSQAPTPSAAASATASASGERPAPNAPPSTSVRRHYFADLSIHGCVTSLDGSSSVEAHAVGVVPVWSSYQPPSPASALEAGASAEAAAAGGPSLDPWAETVTAAAEVGQRLAEQSLRGGATRILGPLQAARPITYGAAEPRLD